MASTIYNCVDAKGKTLKTFTKRQRAVDEYEADSSQKIVAVIASPSGKVIIGDVDFTPAAPEPKATKPKATKAAAPVTDADRAAAAEKLRAKRHELMQRDRAKVLKNAPAEKRCGRCKETRGQHDFNVDLSIPDGLRAWCKFCYKEYAAVRRAKVKAAKLAADKAAAA
jgi:hypothetical protein